MAPYKLSVFCCCIVYWFIHLQLADCAELPSDWRSRIHASTNQSEESLTTGDILIWGGQKPYPMLQQEDSQSSPAIPNKYWPNNGQCIPYSLHPSLDYQLNIANYGAKSYQRYCQNPLRSLRFLVRLLIASSMADTRTGGGEFSNIRPRQSPTNAPSRHPRYLDSSLFGQCFAAIIFLAAAAVVPVVNI